MPEEICRLFFQWTIIAIFAMMASIIAIGFFLLVEMEIDGDISSCHFRIRVKTGIAGAGKRSDKAHFLSVFALESISGSTENRDSVIGRFSDDDFHIFPLLIVPCCLVSLYPMHLFYFFVIFFSFFLNLFFGEFAELVEIVFHELFAPIEKGFLFV